MKKNLFVCFLVVTTLVFGFSCKNNPDEKNDTDVDAKKELTSITLKVENDASVYDSGSTIDKSLIVVTAVYSNGDKKTVTDFTITPEGPLFVDDTKIEVSYTEENVTKSESFEIKVNPKMTISYEDKKASYANPIEIVSDGTYSNENGVITLNDAVEYKISGYFKGKIVAGIKDCKISLEGAYIENENDAAIYCTKKTSISAKKGTENYVISTGTSEEKTAGAAIYGGKGLEFGGKGKCYVVGKINHGIKGDGILFKSSGIYYVEGTKNGSAVNCETFTTEAVTEGDSVTLYCLNSKNGIKADAYISMASGTFYIYDNNTALKTDTSADDKAGEEIEHYIKIENAAINFHSNRTEKDTESNS